MLKNMIQAFKLKDSGAEKDKEVIKLTEKKDMEDSEEAVSKQVIDDDDFGKY